MAEFYVYDLNFNYKGMLDSYLCKSIIWTENYYSCDDMEIKFIHNEKLLELLQPEYFIKKNSGTRAMLIEKINITNSYINGKKTPIVTIKGRGTECILERRVISNSTTISDSVCSIARKAIINNLTSPTVIERKINCITMGTFPESENIERTMQGENLLSFVQTLLQAYKFGFYCMLDFTNKKLKFTIIAGTDRTASKLKKVEFSPDLDNFCDSEYYIDKSTDYNCCIALSGEDGEGNVITAVPTEPTGLNRRELYRDCSDYDFSGSGSSGVTRLLKPFQKECLAENRTNETIEGKIIDGILYEYNVDYFVGDIVIINDGYRHKINKRLISMTEYYSCGSCVLTPTFEDV